MTDSHKFSQKFRFTVYFLSFQDDFHKTTMVNYDPNQKGYKQFLESAIQYISQSVSRDINTPAEEDSLSVLSPDVDSQSVCRSSVDEESSTTNSWNLCTEHSTGSGACESDYCQRIGVDRSKLCRTRVLGEHPSHLTQQHIPWICSWIYEDSEEDEDSLNGYDSSNSSVCYYVSRKKKRAPACHFCRKLNHKCDCEGTTSTSSN